MILSFCRCVWRFWLDPKLWSNTKWNNWTWKWSHSWPVFAGCSQCSLLRYLRFGSLLLLNFPFPLLIRDTQDEFKNTIQSIWQKQWNKTESTVLFALLHIISITFTVSFPLFNGCISFAGHYMFVEASLPRRQGDLARFISPISYQPHKLCLQFW